MRKRITSLLVTALLVTTICGCGTTPVSNTSEQSTGLTAEPRQEAEAPEQEVAVNEDVQTVIPEETTEVAEERHSESSEKHQSETSENKSIAELNESLSAIRDYMNSEKTTEADMDEKLEEFEKAVEEDIKNNTGTETEAPVEDKKSTNTQAFTIKSSFGNLTLHFPADWKVTDIGGYASAKPNKYISATYDIRKASTVDEVYEHMDAFSRDVAKSDRGTVDINGKTNYYMHNQNSKGDTENLFIYCQTSFGNYVETVVSPIVYDGDLDEMLNMFAPSLYMED